jgi:hypothetical protein
MGKIGELNPMGRRSTTIQLILDVLGRSRRKLDVDEIRGELFLGHHTARRPRLETPKLIAGWLSWVILQLRQAQRLAMEGLLSWFEVRLADGGDRDTEVIIRETLKAIRKSKAFPLTEKGRWGCSYTASASSADHSRRLRQRCIGSSSEPAPVNA